jgi:predicted transcriptional regulator YheO
LPSKRSSSHVNSPKSPALDFHLDEFLKNLSLVVDAIGDIFGSHCEVVLHDLRHPERSVIAIANGHVTGRTIGSPLIASPIQDLGMKPILESGTTSSEIVSNYISRTRDGRALKSTTVIFRDSKGKARATLCINLDLTEFSGASRLLGTICGEFQKPEFRDHEAAPKKDQSLPEDMASIIKSVIDDAISQIPVPVHAAEKFQKMDAVKIMHERGLFLIKGGAEYAAHALGVSRFTIYNYLKELEILRRSKDEFMRNPISMR